MWGKTCLRLACSNCAKHAMHRSAMASTQAKLGDHAGHMYFNAKGPKLEGLLFEGPEKVKGLRGTAVPKEPLGPKLKGLELGFEAGSDSQAVELGIPPPCAKESIDLDPCCA